MAQVDRTQSLSLRCVVQPRVDNIRARGKERDLGNDSAIARAAGIDPGGFNRLMRGKTRPGLASIEGLLNVFPDLKFEDLFERVPVRTERS